MVAAENAPQSAAGWDEAQCIAGLAQLEQLRQQLDDLRLAIPRVVESLNSPPSPAMFKGFKRSIDQSNAGIKSLRTQWHSSETQELFEHAKESLSKNADLSAAGQVSQYGWTERAASQREAAKRKDQGKKVKEEVHVSLSKEEVARMVEEFRKKHPSIKVHAALGGNNFTIQFISGSLNHKFDVAIEQQDANGPCKLNAECLGVAEPFLSITRCISSRPQANDLQYLLDMIASYKTIKALNCAKCERMLDDQLLVPTARRSKQVSEGEGKGEVVWQALHEKCLE